ncbi:hypothetical protein JCM11251_000385 [Rhodosporidiobolus azoricus]
MAISSLPPGLSLSHLPARLALSTPTILRLIVIHLARQHGFGSDRLHLRAPAHYAALRAVALVSKEWAAQARRLLHEEMSFWSGNAQMKVWLTSVERMESKGRERTENTQVSFADQALVSFAENGEGVKAKWSEEVLLEAMSKMRGVRTLLMGFTHARDVPVEVLLHEGLTKLEDLGLCCPLRLSAALATRKLPFALSTLSAACLFPQQSATCWSSTFALLSSSLHNLTSLDFGAWSASLPTSHAIEAFFFPWFMPAASSLVTLELPSFTLNPSSWRLALFACACSNLKRLLIQGDVSAQAIRELLPAFTKSRLEELVLNKVELALGTGMVHQSLLDWQDPLDALSDVLVQWPDEPIPSAPFARSSRRSSPAGSSTSSETLAASPSTVSSSAEVPLAVRSTSPPAFRCCKLKKLEIKAIKYKQPSYEVVARFKRVAGRIAGVEEVEVPDEEEGREESLLSEEEAARLDSLIRLDHETRQKKQLKFNNDLDEMLRLIDKRQKEGKNGRPLIIAFDQQDDIDGWLMPARDMRAIMMEQDVTEKA